MPVALTWGSYVDTDLNLSEFFPVDHTLSLYVMPQFPYASPGPLLVSRPAGAVGAGWFRLGQGGFGWKPAPCAADTTHVVEGSGASEYLVDAEHADPKAQAGWRLCLECHGLFFAGFGGGVCPAGGQHRAWPSVEYRVLHDLADFDLLGTPIEQGWRWCGQCQLLFHSGSPTLCPARNPDGSSKSHDSTGSFRYAMRQRPVSAEFGLHAHWQRCRGCGGLHYGGTGTSVDLHVGELRRNYPRQVLRRGMWHHLALTRKNDKLRLYLNGVQAGSAIDVSGVAVPADSIRLGRTDPSRVSGTDQFYGLVDDLAVFDRAFTAAEINSLAHRVVPMTGEENGLISGWPLSAGPHPDRLDRVASLHGGARIVELGANRNNYLDRALLPTPVPAVGLQLPFPAGEVWGCGQSVDDPNGTHSGGASFCYDFFRTVGSSEGSPFYAPATGVTVDVTWTGRPGPGRGNEFVLQTAPDELVGFGHFQLASAKSVTGAMVPAGAEIARTGNTGVPSFSPHVHTGSFGPVGVMFAAGYSNYQVSIDRGKTWRTVAVGVPQAGEWIRNLVAPGRQDGWRWCRRCGALHFPANGPGNVCTAGGRHDASDSDNYTLIFDGAGQPDWRWCKRCGALFWTGAVSRCPAGGSHDQTGSGRYTMTANGIGHQAGWRWCRRCSSMFFGALASVDRCPVGGAHDPTGSFDYTVLSDADRSRPFGQSGWRRCQRCGCMYFDRLSGPAGVCPTGVGGHTAYPFEENPQRYELLHDLSPSLGQNGWRWCSRCEGLHQPVAGTPGVCPAGGEHNAAGSADYRLVLQGARPGELGWRRCQRCRGLFIGSGHCAAGGSHDATGSDAYQFDPTTQLG